MQVPCTKCETGILEVTAKTNGGLCGPCARGAGFCEVCGKRVWHANSSGQFFHFDCYQKQRDEAVSAASGVSWANEEEIHWEVLQTTILEATRGAFQRLAEAHPGREVMEVVVAYRIDEGIRIEPCVTFHDGSYFNAGVDDRALYEALEPVNRALTQIIKSVKDDQLEHFEQTMAEKVPIVMRALFEILTEEKFRLPLSTGHTKILKEF